MERQLQLALATYLQGVAERCDAEAKSVQDLLRALGDGPDQHPARRVITGSGRRLELVPRADLTTSQLEALKRERDELRSENKRLDELVSTLQSELANHRRDRSATYSTADQHHHHELQDRLKQLKSQDIRALVVKLDGQLNELAPLEQEQLVAWQARAKIRRSLMTQALAQSILLRPAKQLAERNADDAIDSIMQRLTELHIDSEALNTVAAHVSTTIRQHFLNCIGVDSESQETTATEPRSTAAAKSAASAQDHGEAERAGESGEADADEARESEAQPDHSGDATSDVMADDLVATTDAEPVADATVAVEPVEAALEQVFAVWQEQRRALDLDGPKQRGSQPQLAADLRKLMAKADVLVTDIYDADLAGGLWLAPTGSAFEPDKNEAVRGLSDEGRVAACILPGYRRGRRILDKADVLCEADLAVQPD